ncbi:zinc ribbon domain-containing protein [Burkholderia pseudomallei]|uniref:zinc ribbon domain-containing protein n=1 Tax=Burkholderia pseudomallei TaxID=28450 RepID=UPI001F5087E2|nr:zinc ribbon domain-containing protein [Burkholderia pseudomallei]
MLTDCPHCYKQIHDEADYCPHCRQYVPNASEMSGSGIDGEGFIKFLVLSVVVSFGLGMALDYLSWWSNWEFVPCMLVAMVLGGLVTAKLSD